MNRWITIGKTGAAHGTRGWTRVVPITEDPGCFESLEGARLKPVRGEGDSRSVRVEGVKYQAKGILVKFEGIESRDEARVIVNHLVQIPESELPPIEEDGTYYFYQIEGIEVKDKKGRPMGRLESVFQTGSNDVYVIRAPDEKEYYLPALKVCVLSVDVEAKIMVIDGDWLT